MDAKSGRIDGWLAVLGWLLLLLAVADWVLLRIGWALHDRSVLVLLVGAALAAFLGRACTLAWALRRAESRRLRAGTELLLLVGVALALLSGTANWMLRLQGFVVLRERESVRLQDGTDLQAFDGGPWASVDEMNLMMELDELELVASDGGFLPRSRLRIWREGEDPTALQVQPRASASSGSLHFLQGAFGFAPRLIILKNEETVFDRVVPFTTQRHGLSGITFQGSFLLESEKLGVVGSVSLVSLDEAMRGHATLELTVAHAGSVIGQGSLLPGHFAEIGESYRVGFVGLEKWSEILISRRNYRNVVLAGTSLALLGALLWPLAAWRDR